VLLNTLTELDIYATHNIVINKRYMCLGQPFFVVLTLAIDSFMATGSFVAKYVCTTKGPHFFICNLHNTLSLNVLHRALWVIHVYTLYINNLYYNV